MYDYSKFLEYWQLHLDIHDAPLDIIDQFNQLGSEHTVKACILGGFMTSLIGNMASSNDHVVRFDLLTMNAAVAANALIIWMDNRQSPIVECINGSILFIASSGLADVQSIRIAMREYSDESAAVLARFIGIIKDNPPTWES